MRIFFYFLNSINAYLILKKTMEGTRYNELEVVPQSIYSSFLEVLVNSDLYYKQVEDYGIIW